MKKQCHQRTSIPNLGIKRRATLQNLIKQRALKQHDHLLKLHIHLKILQPRTLVAKIAKNLDAKAYICKKTITNWCEACLFAGSFRIRESG
jgi:hypothetical protein